MKKCNVVQSFTGGWKVGVSDNNQVIVETPTGEVFQPYEGPAKRLFGTSEAGRAIPLPVEADDLVRRLWKKKDEVEARAQAEHEDEIEKLARELSGEDEEEPTLDDLGFGDGKVRIEDI